MGEVGSLEKLRREGKGSEDWAPGLHHGEVRKRRLNQPRRLRKRSQ